MNDEPEFSALDRHFAELILRLNGQPDGILAEAARTVSARRAEGHICVPLSALEGSGIEAKLRATRVVGAPGENKPLILDASGRLYLQRYWAYEAQLAAAIRKRLNTPAACDEALLRKGLDRFFQKNDDQRRAAETAVRKNFGIITGGPGTGKTRTIAILLALLVEQFAAQFAKPPRLALAAPTGKAAARMKESLTRALTEIPGLEALRAVLPSEATTLHRLLGPVRASPYFRHDAAHPLALDVVIVDEASMVDLALMAKLFAAVRPQARLILLGDKDQLASVEAGNVLGDLCQSNGPLAAHVVELRQNYRFQADSGIHQLSQLINAGDSKSALALLATTQHSDLGAAPTPDPSQLSNALTVKVLTGYRTYLEAPDPAPALARLNDFRILCALRRGPFGVENLNRLAEQALTSAGLIEPISTHYHGRPILILTNDPTLKLFNGDVGLLWRDPEADGELRAFFQDATGGLRRLLPARLPEHETSFAMTVHKSQGSEFGRVLLVLPDRDSPLLTRELLYTGLTRARQHVELWAGEALLRTACARRTERASGLRDALAA